MVTPMSALMLLLRSFRMNGVALDGLLWNRPLVQPTQGSCCMVLQPFTIALRYLLKIVRAWPLVMLLKVPGEATRVSVDAIVLQPRSAAPGRESPVSA